MPATRSHKRARARFATVLHKPRGLIHPRVQQVGPEHFGIVSVDCAKARFKWMLCDFYGNVLVPPTEVAHNRVELEAAMAQFQEARRAHDLRDVLVAVERTGRYHHVPRNAFARVVVDVRTVHPFTSKHFRESADPGVKTDDTDLAGIHGAAVNGFALVDATTDLEYQELQLAVRQRRDLVRKTSTLCCQIREHLDAAFPGYAAGFADFWGSQVALLLVRHFASAAALAQVGRQGLGRWLRAHDVRCHQRTVDAVLAWADQAAPPDPAAARQRLLVLALEDDRQRKTQEIQALERELAARLVRTPYVLLLSIPGINVVSAADFGGEMGPISSYAHPRTITGRAGLYPSRYQSDRVDRADGPLVRAGNHALRQAILQIADNLIRCHRYFGQLAHQWRLQGKDPRWTHVKIASRFCRIAFHRVAGRQVCHHPSMQGRHYILDKRNVCHREHQTPLPQVMEDLLAAVAQLPRSAHAEEAKPLLEELHKIRAGQRRGPQRLGDILPLVLARLGVGVVQSTESGEGDRT